MIQLRRLFGSLDNGAWGEEPAEDGSDTPCVRAADFDFTKLRVSLSSAPLRQIDAHRRDRLLLRSGDIVLEKSGGGEKQVVGRAVLYDEDRPAICSNFAARIRPATGVSPRYLTYLLAALYFNGATARAVLQTTGIQNLDTDAWLPTPVPELPLEEQRRIADFLDDQVGRIDNIVAARQRQIAAVADAAGAMLEELLAAVSAMPRTRLGRFVRGIEQGWSPQCDALPAKDGEWGVLRVSAVRSGQFVPSENKRLPDDLNPQREYEVRPGDLLITRANTPALVGAFAVAPQGIPQRLIFSDKIMRVILSEEVSAAYVTLIGQSRGVRATLSGAGTGTSQSMVNIRGADVRDLVVPLLTRDHQERLVLKHGADAERSKLLTERFKTQLNLLGELKKSLISAAVSGEFDMSTADGSRVPV